VDDDLTYRAERAVLGAMIADRQLAARLDYLEPADFTNSRHRAVFRAIRQFNAAPQPGNWRDQIASTTGRQVTRKYLDELVGECPAPAHGPAYGALVVQAVVYRQAGDHADEMDAQAAALRDRVAEADDLGTPGAGQVAGLSTLLAETARAVRSHTAALAPPAPDPAAALRLRPDWPKPAWPPPATLGELREDRVLSAVLHGHAQTGQILSFLPAAAFTSPERQEIFRAVHRLNQSGHPVDELTVSWELATHSAVTAILSPGNAPQPGRLDGYVHRLAGTNAGDQPPLLAAQVLDAQLRYRTSRGAEPAAGAVGDPLPGNSGQARRPGAVQARVQPAPDGVARPIGPQNAGDISPLGPQQNM
jgi:DnaB-like helicase N terminal domain